MNNCDGKATWKVTIPVSLMCILSLVIFVTPVYAAAGDLILDSEIVLSDTTLLKEGYSLSLDKVWWNETGPGKEIGVANFTIFENGEVVKRLSANEEDYFYYNKTIDDREYTIIESKVDSIFAGSGPVILRPIRQYSDGSVIIEPDFITASLNPYTNKTLPEEWNRTFGGVYDDFGHYGQSLQQTNDGGYILIGSIRMYTPGRMYNNLMYNNYAYLIKTDTNGNEQWNRTFEDIDLKNAYSVQQTSDGGYILAGTVGSYRIYRNFPSPLVRWETDAILVKTDSNGSIVWHKTMDASGNDHVISVVQTHDGGYILAGFSRSYTDSAWLIKTDANGSEQWYETFAVPDDNTCFVWQTDDEGYILASGSCRYGAGSTDAWVIKTDANGKQEWNKKFESDCLDTVYSIEQTPDGGYLLAGSRSTYYKSYNACLVKTDANGIEQWNRTIGPDLTARISSICSALDGGYVLAGKIDTAKNPEFKGQIRYENDDAWLFKTDAYGNLEWSKTFGGLKNDEARFVQLTSDGGYIIAGTTESYGAGSSDLWLVKVAGMEVDFVQPGVSANNTSMEEVRLSDNNVTETLQSPPEKSIPGFEFVGAVFSVLVMLLLRRRIL